MALDHIVYVGPFVQCQNGLVVDGVPLLTCVNPQCPEHKKSRAGNFCCQCGKAITEIFIPNNHPKVRTTDLQRALVDLQLARNLSLHQDLPGQTEKTDLWIPTSRSTYSRLFNAKNRRPAFHIPTPTSMAVEISMFRKDFKCVIGKLQEAYGAASVCFSWGVLAFPS